MSKPPSRPVPDGNDPATLHDLIHASCVSLGARGLLITGPSGSGKSSLALSMMALGAGLVADDRVEVAAQPDGPPVARCPKALSGMIEARGIGLLRADPAPPVPLVAVIDLGIAETSRLPPERETVILGWSLPLLHNPETPHVAAALMQYLKGGRVAA